MTKLRLAILISGRGSNMKALIAACEQPDFPATVSLVISNVPNAGGIEYAQQHGIPTLVINHKDFENRAAFEAELCAALKDIDLVCLAGFMRILGPTFFQLNKIPVLNIHPSLLPKHKGLHTHEAVLEAGDQVHGCTVHIVTPELDDGDIIVQRQVPVLAEDTSEILAARVLIEEHKAYPEAVRLLAARL